MSRRETVLEISLQQWRGVDQRTSPTRIRDGFFVFSRGVYFGLGDNAERLPGKVLSGKVDLAALQIYRFENTTFIQGLGRLWSLPVDELFAADGFIFKPVAPDAPTLSGITSSKIDVTIQDLLPVYTLSFSIQRSTDDVTWTTIATGLSTSDTFSDTGLLDGVEYFYRVVTVGAAAQTFGPSASATTTPIATTNRVTESSEDRVTEAGDQRVTN